MKKVLNIFFFALLIILGVACSDDESRLENKWQLRQYVHVDGTVQREDSVFYNFMDGSFSAICLLPDGKYRFIFGNYVFRGNELSITILPDFTSDDVYKRYLNWEGGGRIFKVQELTPSVMQLNYKEEKSIFRKY